MYFTGTMTPKPETFEDILSLAFWDNPAALSEALGVPYVTAQVMRHRKSIGDDHWPRLIEALREHGITLTTDNLLAMKLAMRQRRKVERQMSRIAHAVNGDAAA